MTQLIVLPMFTGQRSFFFPGGFIVENVNSPAYLRVAMVSLMSVDRALIMFTWVQGQKEEWEQLSPLEWLSWLVPVFELGSELLGSL